MQPHIRQLEGSCELCQKTKCSQRCHVPLQSITPKQRGGLVCVDVIGTLPASRMSFTRNMYVYMRSE